MRKMFESKYGQQYVQEAGADATTAKWQAQVVHPFIHRSIHPFVHSVNVQLLPLASSHTSAGMSTHSCVRLLVHSSIRSSIAFIHCIHPSIHLFSDPFVH
eukprot:354656-Chlamydomonas_euryale.AAC.2